MAKRSVEYYNKGLKELDQNYYLVINEYLQQYPRAKTYPETKGYKKALNEDLTNLKSLQSDFFIFKNDLEKDIKTTSMGIYKADKIITKIDKENTKLKASLPWLSQASAGATGMFNDAQATYNQSLLGNVYLIIGMVSVATYIYKNRV